MTSNTILSDKSTILSELPNRATTPELSLSLAIVVNPLRAEFYLIVLIGCTNFKVPFNVNGHFILYYATEPVKYWSTGKGIIWLSPFYGKISPLSWTDDAYILTG